MKKRFCKYLFPIFAIFGCSSNYPPLEVVKYVDLDSISVNGTKLHHSRNLSKKAVIVLQQSILKQMIIISGF